MQIRTIAWLALLMLVASSPAALANGKSHPQATNDQAAQKPVTDTQKQNIQEYIELMRSNVRDQKAEMMGAVLQLNIDDAAKFWPIYSEYDAELTKINDLRVANIEDYANNYTQMTDDKADALIQKAMEYRKLRGELLAKCYGRVKQSLGAITAARFVQVEEQMLLIIDLQILSSLPIVGE